MVLGIIWPISDQFHNDRTWNIFPGKNFPHATSTAVARDETGGQADDLNTLMHG